MKVVSSSQSSFLIAALLWTSVFSSSSLFVGVDAGSSKPSNDLKVCVAIDSSGPICSSGEDSSNMCEFCNDGTNEGSKDCALGGPASSSGEEDDDDGGSCCANYGTFESFAKDYVEGLSAEVPSATFSIVQYGTKAFKIADAGSSASDAAIAIKKSKYTGGYTNTQHAILNCIHLLDKVEGVKPTLVIVDGGEPETACQTGEDETITIGDDGCTVDSCPCKGESGSTLQNMKEATKDAADFAGKAGMNVIPVTLRGHYDAKKMVKELIDLTIQGNSGEAENEGSGGGDENVSRVASQDTDGGDTVTNKVCIGIDTSGPICSDCAESSNYRMLTTVAANYVNGMPSGSTSFSVVQYASNAHKLADAGSSALVALEAIGKSTYMGGFTNTQHAILQCIHLLGKEEGDGSGGSIVLVNGGEPEAACQTDEDETITIGDEGCSIEKCEACSGEESDSSVDTPAAAAKDAAALAKKAGMDLIPVTVKGHYDLDKMVQGLVDLTTAGVGGDGATTASAEEAASSGDASVNKDEDGEIGVCVGIDTSGPICLNCGGNYGTLTSFAADYVKALPSGSSSFAVVQYGSSSSKLADMGATALEAATAIQRSRYMGGYTNTQHAILNCIHLLDKKGELSKPTIVLVGEGAKETACQTDEDVTITVGGENSDCTAESCEACSGESGLVKNPEEAALDAAALAAEGGMNFIPVTIKGHANLERMLEDLVLITKGGKAGDTDERRLRLLQGGRNQEQGRLLRGGSKLSFS